MKVKTTCNHRDHIKVKESQSIIVCTQIIRSSVKTLSFNNFSLKKALPNHRVCLALVMIRSLGRIHLCKLPSAC